jgi:hypothetical protein
MLHTITIFLLIIVFVCFSFLQNYGFSKDFVVHYPLLVFYVYFLKSKYNCWIYRVYDIIQPISFFFGN